MSTQYNTIQAPYDALRKGTIALLERRNVHDALIPHLHGARVLDLACGSGFYSLDLLQWGAASVLGVDVSSAMLAEARRRRADVLPAGGERERARFVEADCSTPVAFWRGEEEEQGKPFDVVFAAWLLNYASTPAQLSQMFRTVALNLKPGGIFLAVTPVPTEDPVAFHAAENAARPLDALCLRCEPTGEAEEEGTGVSVYNHGETAVGPLDFDDFHLRQGVWEEAARAAGFRQEVRWRVTEVPEGWMEGYAGEEELESYKAVPHYGLLEVWK